MQRNRKNYRKKKMMLFAGLTAVLFSSCGILQQAASQEQEEKSSKSLPVLTIGSTIFSPYFYVGEDGAYTGMDKEIAEEACKRMGYEPEFTVITWGEQDQLLQEKTIDCVWCCVAMNGREEDYQWAGPYWESPEVVVVAADSPVQNLQDLQGQTIAAQIDSRGEKYFLEEAKDQNNRVDTFSSMDEVFADFSRGYADAAAGHREILEEYVSRDPEQYRILEDAFQVTELGVAFEKQRDPELPEQLTKVLQEMTEDGTIEKIAESYGQKHV